MILYVDDAPQSLKIFSRIFVEFKVVTAASVEEAKEIIKEGKIKSVITDQRMPGGNGIELLQWLHANYPHITRIITTAYSDRQDLEDEEVIDEIISKPWDFEEIKKLIIKLSVE